MNKKERSLRQVEGIRRKIKVGGVYYRATVTKIYKSKENIYRIEYIYTGSDGKKEVRDYAIRTFYKSFMY